MDVGQAAASSLWQQAESGTFKMEPEAAKRCAEIFQRFSESVEAQITRAATLHRLSGFGTFRSAVELESGFGRKGQALSEALAATQEAAIKMSAAYLRAGGMIDEAEAENKKAIALAAKGAE